MKGLGRSAPRIGDWLATCPDWGGVVAWTSLSTHEQETGNRKQYYYKTLDMVRIIIIK
jgi:hypothetical protein